MLLMLRLPFRGSADAFGGVDARSAFTRYAPRADKKMLGGRHDDKRDA